MSTMATWIAGHPWRRTADRARADAGRLLQAVRVALVAKKAALMPPWTSGAEPEPFRAAATMSPPPKLCDWAALDRERASSMADEGGVSAAARASEGCEDRP